MGEASDDLVVARERRNFYAARFVLLEEAAYVVVRAKNTGGDVAAAIEALCVELQRGRVAPDDTRLPCGCGSPYCEWETDYDAIVARCPNCNMGIDRGQTCHGTGRLGCPECHHGEPDHEHAWKTGESDPEAKWCECGERVAKETKP